MICQDCKKREAQVHLTQIVNNEKTSLSLCHECAAARGFHSPLDNMPFPLADILSNMAANLPTKTKQGADSTLKCPSCGMTFETFTQQGRFGCGECYKTFRNRLEVIMRKIHGASMHRGKTPVFTETADDNPETVSIKEEERLKEELQKAIENEDFERAAELRDKLKQVRESLALDK